MRKFRWLFILVPALLLLGGYVYVHQTLRSSIHKDEKHTGQDTPTSDTLGGKKVPATDLRPLFIKRVQQLVKKSSNGLYNLAVADLKLDVLSSTLSLQGVQLTPDTAVADSLRRLHLIPADVFTIFLDSLRIEGINLDDALTSKTMDYSLIKLMRPVITIHHQKGAVKKDVAEKEDFSQRFLKELEKLSIKNLVVEEGTVNLYNDTKKDAPVVLKHVAVRLNSLQLDSTTRRDKNRFLFAQSGTVSFRNYSRRTPDGLYTMKIGAVTIKAPQDNVQLTNVSFTSPFNRAQFSKRQKKSKELYNLSLPSVTLRNVNWWALLNAEEVVADELHTTGGRLSIYLDRSLPPRNRMGNFPSQLLMKLPVQLRIAKARMRDLDFSYAEYNPLSKATGTIYLDNVQLRITNLSNERRLHPQPLTIAGSGLFMHAVPVTAQFRFDMARYKSGAFTAHIKMKGFNGALINPFTEPMGMMKLERGTLQSAEATVRGDERQATGVVFIPYTDLKLAILERDTDGKALDKKDVTSLLANLLVLKRDNPKPGEAPRRETAAFTRIPEGGFFMLIWKTILVGALKTIGAPTNIARKTVSSSLKN
jgi:hypothetical protein